MIEITTTMAEALQRAQSLVNQGEYILGTGDYRPRQDANGNSLDLPYTQHNGSGPSGADCAGFAVCWCYKVVRHQPGFNHGSWATISDDINVDSVIEDAHHTQEMGTVRAGVNLDTGFVANRETGKIALEDICEDPD